MSVHAYTPLPTYTTELAVGILSSEKRGCRAGRDATLGGSRVGSGEFRSVSHGQSQKK